MATNPSTKLRAGKQIKKVSVPSEEKSEMKSAFGKRIFGVEPSWTGPHGVLRSQKKRVERWLCDADNKCVPVTSGDFTENLNWRIFRIMAEFVEGFEFLSKLDRVVSIFGSARISSGNRYYQMARKLAMLCGQAGYSIVTGGGPGIMEAGNRGAADAKADSIGLDISLPMEQRRNPFINKSLGFHYFFTRKVMLSAAAQAYVFFPGGFGTFNELFEIIELIQTGKMTDDVPVIMVGRAFWQPLIDWIQQYMCEDNRYIEKTDMKIMNLVDTAEEAFEIIKKTHERTL